MEGKDVIGIAQTGTGKTGAYLLPLMHRMLQHPPAKHPGVLVLAPTRELAQQIEKDVQDFGKYTRLKGAAVFGGVGFDQQKRALQGAADIIVATPGRLLDHIRRGHWRAEGIHALVLDEADRMLDMGFMPDVLQILSRLPKKRQTLLFSATMPPAILSLARDQQKDPVMVEIMKVQQAAVGIRHAVYPVHESSKLNLLVRLLQEPSIRQALVFVSMKRKAGDVETWLRYRNISCAPLHSDLGQRDRDKAMERFRNGEVRVLVATDLAQRGLDVENISHVINFDVPRSAEEYVHRVGRTARAGAEGDAFTFVGLGEEESMRSIEHKLGLNLPRVTLPDFDYGPYAALIGFKPPPPLKRRRR
jgi:ATP-dependent RNA helicase RhlE